MFLKKKHIFFFEIFIQMNSSIHTHVYMYQVVSLNDLKNENKYILTLFIYLNKYFFQVALSITYKANKLKTKNLIDLCTDDDDDDNEK